MQGLLALQRYFDFSGRSARAEYWQFMAIIFLSGGIALMLDLAIRGPYQTPVFTVIVVLACIIPAYAVGVRRLHDRGRTGWWIGVQAGISVISLIFTRAAVQAQYTAMGDVLNILATGVSVLNLLMSVFLLIQVVQRGDDHGNQYGPNPLDNPTPAPRIADLVAKAQDAATNVNARPASQPRRPTDGDPLEQIERLAKMRDAGLLTEAEFTEQKAAYLSRL